MKDAAQSLGITLQVHDFQRADDILAAFRGRLSARAPIGSS
jgi:hypothetical protein